MANSAWESAEFRGGADGWDNGPAGVIATLDFFNTSPVGFGGRVQYWSGSEWIYADLKGWTGLDWQPVSLSYWSGSQWLLTT